VLNSFELTGSQLLYAPQFAAGGEWRSTLILINLENRPAAVSLSLFRDDGSPWGAAATVELAARGRAVVPHTAMLLGGDAAGLQQGYLRIQSDASRVTGCILFGDSSGAQFQAALPLVSQTQTELIFAHVASDDRYFTGVALLNPNSRPVTLTLTVSNASGDSIGVYALELPAKARLARLLTELLPGLPYLTRGYFRVSASLPIAGFAVFGTHDLSVLSAILAQ